MKAMVYDRYGSPDHLKLEELPKPVPRDNQVLIQVRSASINAWDYDLLMGRSFIVRLVGGGIFSPNIRVLGCDIAGTVVGVGKNVKTIREGDEVFGDVSAKSWGGFSEFTLATEAEVCIKPSEMTFDEAAAIPQAASLALQALRMYDSINADHKILINGAGGGVGTFGIQLAKLRKAEVTAVDHTSKLKLMRSLGADHVIDFTKEDFTKNGQQYDLIVDNVVNRKAKHYKRSLSSKGMLVMMGGNIPLVFAIAIRSQLLSTLSRKETKKMKVLPYRVNTEDLSFLATLYHDNQLKVVLDKVYQLEDLASAMHYFGDGRTKGKVVITNS